MIASLDEDDSEDFGVSLIPTSDDKSPALDFFVLLSSMEEITSDEEQDKSKAFDRVL